MVFAAGGKKDFEFIMHEVITLKLSRPYPYQAA